MLERVTELLAALGYETVSVSDRVILKFAVQKVENAVKTEINWDSIPPELEEAVICRVLGEFLLSKKTFAPDDLTMLDLSSETVKQITAGDTNFTFGAGEGAHTDQARLDAFIGFLLSCGENQFGAFRKLRW